MPQYDQAMLTATIMKDTLTVTTLTKRIVMHGTDMYVEGVQSGIYDENGDIPAVGTTFTIPANNGNRFLSRRLTMEYRDSIPLDSLPVIIDDPDLPVIPDNPTYGITEIYGGADITLYSDRFHGMTISFSGEEEPEYLTSNNGDVVSFRMPEVSSITDVQGYYYVVLHATSEGGCHDFDLYFKVIPVEGETIGDNEISLYYSDNSITVDFNAMEWTELPNGQLQATPWYLSIYRMSNGLQKHYSVNNTESRTVDISTWPADVYIVRVESGENRYTKKFLKQ
ncbi:MAG: T9SS type A sorting domain-containing protein [Prevotella sp.]|nr:T9SS type A sorting domain-containing protein [Prevotella sp.]